MDDSSTSSFIFHHDESIHRSSYSISFPLRVQASLLPVRNLMCFFCARVCVRFFWSAHVVCVVRVQKIER